MSFPISTKQYINTYKNNDRATQMLTLKYYYVNKRKIILKTFSKYYYNDGKFYNKNTGNVVNYYRNGKYNRAAITDDEGKQSNILIGRAIASTLYGPPPTPAHTADHINKNSTDDFPENIRWLSKSGQTRNRTLPKTTKTAFIIIKDGIENTAKEWAKILEGKNPLGRDYNQEMIKYYAQQKKYGFSYKEYPDLPGEVWKEIRGSKNNKGCWEISNMSRLRWITRFTTNVISGDRLSLITGYPSVVINKKSRLCHILAFETFFPEEYDAKKPEEMILHENDDKMDFRPSKLRLGTSSDNGMDAHKNGRFDDTKSERKRCASYINGMFEKEYDSQHDAVKYLKSNGITKAARSGIRKSLIAFGEGKISVRYDRTWQFV